MKTAALVDVILWIEFGVLSFVLRQISETLALGATATTTAARGRHDHSRTEQIRMTLVSFLDRDQELWQPEFRLQLMRDGRQLLKEFAVATQKKVLLYFFVCAVRYFITVVCSF